MKLLKNVRAVRRVAKDKAEAKNTESDRIVIELSIYCTSDNAVTFDRKSHTTGEEEP